MAKHERTCSKNFREWSSKNQRNYSPEAANTDEHRGEGSYSRETRVGGSRATKITIATPTEVCRTRQQCEGNAEVCALDQHQ